ncbi:MAG: hypothetical protein WCK11_02420 [Candidatus Falkowbacteria bacterium]
MWFRIKLTVLVVLVVGCAVGTYCHLSADFVAVAIGICGLWLSPVVVKGFASVAVGVLVICLFMMASDSLPFD